MRIARFILLLFTDPLTACGATIASAPTIAPDLGLILGGMGDTPNGHAPAAGSAADGAVVTMPGAGAGSAPAGGSGAEPLSISAVLSGGAIDDGLPAGSALA